MSEQPALLEATQENFPRLVLENSLKGPVLVLLDMLGADDERTRRYRQILFAH